MKRNEASGAKIRMSVCLWGGWHPFGDVAESAQPCTIVHENGHLSLDMQCTILGKHLICSGCVKHWNDNVTRDKHST